MKSCDERTKSDWLITLDQGCDDEKYLGNEGGSHRIPTGSGLHCFTAGLHLWTLLALSRARLWMRAPGLLRPNFGTLSTGFMETRQLLSVIPLKFHRHFLSFSGWQRFQSLFSLARKMTKFDFIRISRHT